MSSNKIVVGKPLELENTNREVPRLDMECLPKVIKDFVNEASEVLQQPKQYVAISSLVGIAGVLGNKVCVKPHENRTAYPVLWGMLLGESGTGKTPSIQEAIKPIKDIDRRLFDTYMEQHQEYKITLDLFDEEMARLKMEYKRAKAQDLRNDIKDSIVELSKQKPIKPFSREIYTNKATKEALTKKVAENSPNGLLLDIDELMDWLETITKKDRRAEQQLFIEGYNVQSSKSETVGRGTEYIDNLALSIVGGVQTDRYLSFLDSYTGSGLVARFQMLAIAKKQRREPPSGKAISTSTLLAYRSLFESLRAIKERVDIVNTNEIAKAPPQEFYYSEEAKLMYTDWFKSVEDKRHKKNQNDLMIEYLGKSDNTFHSLALIFHLCSGSNSRYISEETTMSVVFFMMYLIECAEWLFTDKDDVLNMAEYILTKPFKEQPKNFTFTASSLGVKWSSIKRKANNNNDLIAESLELLCSRNYLVENGYSSNSKYKKYSFSNSVL